MRVAGAVARKAHASDARAPFQMPNKILMVVTSHDQLGDTGKRTLATGAWARRVPPAAPALTGRRGCRAGKKTGFWLEEYAAPYYVFKDAGAQITVASPKGGQPPLDPASEGENFQTAATRRFTEDKEATALLAASVKLETCDVAAFDAVFYPGGHGPLWDLRRATCVLMASGPFSIASRAKLSRAPAAARCQPLGHSPGPPGSASCCC